VREIETSVRERERKINQKEKGRIIIGQEREVNTKYLIR